LTEPSGNEPAAADLRVLLLARYSRNGASSRVRHYSYIAPLAARGIAVEAQHLIDDSSLARFYAGGRRNVVRIGRSYFERAQLARNLRSFDVIWIEKEALPRLPFWLERGFYGRSRNATVLDFDDFWFARFEGNGKNDSTSWEAAKMRKAILAADLVTAANSSLAGALEEFSGRRPVVFENTIDIETYARARQSVLASRAGDGERLGPRIGWVGTPYTATRYLPAIAGALNRMTHEGLSQTVLIGAGVSVPDIEAQRVAWSMEGEAAAVADLDVGIMPLGTSRFDSYKSCWKLYQCMAAAMPVVATRNGFSETLVDDGVTGFLADSADAFENKLRLLAGDEALRKKMGEAAQATIASRYSLQMGADRMATMFRAVVAGKRTASGIAAEHVFTCRGK